MQTSNKSRLQLANEVINLSLIPSTDVVQLPSSLKMAGYRNVSHCQQQSYSGLRSPGRSYLAFSRRSDVVECDKSCASSPGGTRGEKKKKKTKGDHAQVIFRPLPIIRTPETSKIMLNLLTTSCVYFEFHLVWYCFTHLHIKS